MNHTQEALSLVRRSSYTSGNGSQNLASLDAQHAQVHATLALVEQQRIANLIALSNSERADYLTEPITEEEQQEIVEDYGGFSHLVPVTRLRADIARALGLGDTHG